MKNVSAMLLATLFALFSLISLITADRLEEHSTAAVEVGGQPVSDLGLRFALKP